MPLAYINLNTKQYINFMCNSNFERRIFHDTYTEFQKQSTTFAANGRYNTFSEMLIADNEANVLHRKLHLSIVETVKGLDHRIPVLTDTQGNSILFKKAELKIYHSDLSNKAGHVVAICYTSPRLVLHEIVDDLLILSYNVKGQFNSTFMVKLTNDLVINYEKIEKAVYN